MKEKVSGVSYQKFIARKTLVVVLMMLITIFAGLIAITLGSANLSLKSTINVFLGMGTRQENVIVLNLRLPRICTAILAGFGLGIVGCVMQSVLRNPLAESSTIGVSQGAACGAAFAIIVLGGGAESVTAGSIVTISNPYLVTGCSFVGSMLSTLFILLLSRIKKLNSSTLILSGVALGSMFSGLTTMMEYFADDVKVAAVVHWTFGDLASTFWRDIAIIFAAVFLAFLYYFWNRWNYNAIQSGEETAKSLGVNTNSLMLVGMVVCSLTTAVITSNIGIISFVGIIAPHMMRKFVGSDYRFLLPASGFAGAILLLLGDTVARVIIAPVELPIGAITSFIGAPVFLYIIYREGKRKR